MQNQSLMERAYSIAYPWISKKYSPDLAHDTWIHAIEWVSDPNHELRADTEFGVACWLHSVAINLMKVELRKKCNKARTEMPKEIDNSLAHSYLNQWEKELLEREALKLALKSLSRSDRFIIEARMDGRSYDEIGSHLNIGHDAAKIRTHRAIQKLKSRILRKRARPKPFASAASTC